jgi:hypothetical protein
MSSDKTTEEKKESLDKSPNPIGKLNFDSPDSKKSAARTLNFGSPDKSPNLIGKLNFDSPDPTKSAAITLDFESPDRTPDKTLDPTKSARKLDFRLSEPSKKSKISEDILSETLQKRKELLKLKLPSKISLISKHYIITDNNEIDLVINKEEKIDLSLSFSNINRSLRTYDYEIQNYISSGSYGSVYTAKKISEGNTNYVIKIIINKESFIDEINIISYLLNKCGNCESCPEFICFVQGLEFKNLRFIVYKNAGIDLKTYLERNKNLSDNIKSNIATQLISAINRLHSEFNIFHGDIKATNITIFTNQDGSLRLKLIDFGVSSNLDTDIDNWPNDDNYNIEENRKLSVKYMNKDLNKKNKIIAEMNVVKKLIKEKLGIQADNFQIKYLKYKLKYLALRNKISQ